jgi:radical SAM superfamily enzyme YgiQ (UPF0313 family)
MAGHFLFVHVNQWADFASPDAIPISQGYIMANLVRHGFSAEILGDYRDHTLAPQLFKTRLLDKNLLAVGFSVYEENINRVRAWASFAKSVNPDVAVILGGPQITFMAGTGLAQLPEVDALCRGEGEPVMLGLARALAADTSLGKVPGLCVLKDGRPLETGPGPTTEDLDDLPSPYLRGTLDPTGKDRVILFSSRGCTSPCTFCYTTKASNRRVRFHSIDRLIEELLYLKTRGHNDFWFADPNFAYSRARLETLLEAMINRVPGIRFWCQTRYNLVDRELVALLKRAGARTLAFGLESADPEVLKRINKGLDPARMMEAIRLVQEAEIETELFTLFGLPGETMARSLATLDFVRRNRVAITGNSISQQLHLFFGTPIAEDPAGHGITPLPRTRPDYLGICRDFRTDGMTEEEIRCMGVIWRLNRRDFAEKVGLGEDLFNIAGFINRHRERLAARPEAEMLLARIYMQLDEYPAAAESMERLRANFGPEPEVARFLARPLTAYRSRRRGVARPGCRVIFDCRGLVGGAPIPATVCHYRIACLGDGSLLPDFDGGLTDLKAGSAVQFDVRFPADYGAPDLAGRTIPFQAFLYQVLEPIVFDDIAALRDQPPHNMYRFDDLVGLQKYNENLYYMVLRDAVLHSRNGNLNNLLALFNYYLKLGFIDKALEIAHTLPDEASVMGHVGRVFLGNGRAAAALDFLEKAADTSVEIENQRIKARIHLGRYDEAEKIAADPKFSSSLQILNQRVILASLRELPVSDYLSRVDRMLACQVRMMHANM